MLILVAYFWLPLASLDFDMLCVTSFLPSFFPSFLPSSPSSFHLPSFRLAWGLGLASFGSAWLYSAQLGSASLGFLRFGFTQPIMARLHSASFGLVWFPLASLGFPWLGCVVCLLFYRTPICALPLLQNSRPHLQNRVYRIGRL